MFDGVGEIDDDNDDGLESGEGEDEAPRRIFRPVPQSALVGVAPYGTRPSPHSLGSWLHPLSTKGWIGDACVISQQALSTFVSDLNRMVEYSI